MAIYVKISSPVEAYQWDGTMIFRPTESFQPTILDAFSGGFYLDTPDGVVGIKKGEYIVQTGPDSYWSVRQDTFENNYKKIKD